ncbi:MAG: hypothetical protein A3C90_00260 [Candidatus Magasanikbacteria bacterium RIFCSPHIGHO2_02_FULL_51_14]|uniref:SIS domain-containing protein n=1 Tax=Candidatus Magasanikbacteria bacterium RIFCSPHIGHO2_02_FULL_51_14 TaxID=1798683 RepID=A0A1F6MD03_9BACT|nr:MAG: hypothetical protein A3C90_00260 [Candidatus Magasanikbacteria bacterium RIFCSPHIGHO2_02_FULL_51_14]
MEKKSYLDDAINRYPQLSNCREDILAAFHCMEESFLHGGKLLVMGNGGSSSDAEHFCAELTKGVHLERQLHDDERKLFDGHNPMLPKMVQSGLSALSLGVSHSFVTAYMNDVHPEFIFAQQIWVHARAHDVVFSISTSGNSKNVIAGLSAAKVKGLKSILLTGGKESACSVLADISIMVPETEVHKIQELHLPVYHALAFDLEHIFFNREDGHHYRKFARI